MKALQLFSDEALERGRELSTEEIVRFLDEFRRLYGIPDSQQLEKAGIASHCLNSENSLK
jgi:hypothetical protein